MILNLALSNNFTTRFQYYWTSCYDFNHNILEKNNALLKSIFKLYQSTYILKQIHLAHLFRAFYLLRIRPPNTPLPFC